MTPEEKRRQERTDEMAYWAFIVCLGLSCAFIGWLAQSIFGTLGAVLIFIFILWMHS